MILPGKSYETRFARRFEFLSTLNLPTGKYNSSPRKEYNFPQGKYNLPARANITHNSYTPRALGRREVHFRDRFLRHSGVCHTAKKGKGRRHKRRPGALFLFAGCVIFSANNSSICCRRQLDIWPQGDHSIYCCAIRYVCLRKRDWSPCGFTSRFAFTDRSPS